MVLKKLLIFSESKLKELIKNKIMKKYEELYGSYVRMNDRFETVHVWSEELAIKNNEKWIPMLISKSEFEKYK